MAHAFHGLSISGGQNCPPCSLAFGVISDRCQWVLETASENGAPRLGDWAQHSALEQTARHRRPGLPDKLRGHPGHARGSIQLLKGLGPVVMEK